MAELTEDQTIKKKKRLHGTDIFHLWLYQKLMF